MFWFRNKKIYFNYALLSSKGVCFKTNKFNMAVVICDQGFVGAARFCAKWGIKLVQATLIPLARSYFPLNCEQADQQIFGSSVKSGLIIGHRNTSLLMSIS